MPGTCSNSLTFAAFRSSGCAGGCFFCAVARFFRPGYHNNLVNNFQFGWNHIYAAFFLSKNTTSVLDAPGGVDSFGNGWDYALDPFTSFASTLGGSDAQARKTVLSRSVVASLRHISG